MAFEFMHYLNHKDDEKENYMSIKLDMSKAFDKVEWNFIKEVMEKMGGPYNAMHLFCVLFSYH